MNRDIIKQRYQIQKGCAKRRGIDFEFTYEQWIAWWGDDIVNRGRGAGKLVMARFNDSGAYHPDNVRKATQEENAIEAHKGKPLSDEHRKKRIGQKHSTESIQKMRDARKQYWAMRNSTKELA